MLDRGFRGFRGLLDEYMYVCDPSLLTLSGWWRASFTGVPWYGLGSLGDSGLDNHKWITDAADPAVGASVNGFSPADFDGTNDRLVILNTVDLTSFIGQSEWWMGCLISADALAGDVGASENPAPVSDNQGAFGVTVCSTGVRALSYQTGVGIRATPLISINTGTWYWIEAWQTGGVLSCSVNGGTAQTVSCTTNTSLLTAQFLKLGKSYNNNYFNGKILEVMISKTVPSAADRTCIREEYLVNRYGVAV
jgi:hypothetical protein